MHPISRKLVECFKKGNKVLIMGNGGSAAMSQHMAAEFMGRFEKDRRPLPAIALTTDTSFITAWSNDTTFFNIFNRQILGLGKVGDIVIGISTSGKSVNVNSGLEMAKIQGITSIDFPRNGKKASECQEYQLRLIHKICREVESEMFP